MRLEQRVEGLDDLVEDRRRPSRGIHLRPLQGQQAAVRPAEPELQLRPADLDAEQPVAFHHLSAPSHR